ncbi:hypothetical protein FB451DRAFT_1564749 [Mycena latifolia]|nr:hypothetical protein FB451DRAFT_1564749 [Mycena latifolia]
MGRFQFLLPILWVISMAGHALSGIIQISSVTGVSIFQCGTYLFKWSGGRPPYKLVTGNEVIATGVTSFSYEWTVNYAAGAVVNFGVTDGFGDSGVTATFVVLASTDSSCLRVTQTPGLRPTTTNSQPTVTPPVFSGSGDSLDVGAIAGGVAGGVVGILLLVLVFRYCRRRKGKAEVAAATPGELESAGRKPVTRGSSTKEPVPQMGYTAAYEDEHKSQPSEEKEQRMLQPATAPAPPHRKEIQASVAELGYEQKTFSQRMVVNNPTTPIQGRRIGEPAVEEEGRTRTTTTPDSKTVMSWEPPASQASSSVVAPPSTSPREQELEQRLRVLESHLTSLDDAPPSYNDKD